MFTRVVAARDVGQSGGCVFVSSGGKDLELRLLPVLRLVKVLRVLKVRKVLKVFGTTWGL